MQATTSFYDTISLTLFKLQYVAQLGAEEYFYLECFCKGPDSSKRSDIPQC
jgi:hypothetical protein